MVIDDSPYRVVWTPDFTEEVFLAVDYVQNHLKMPIAAKNLLNGISETLDARKIMPEAAVKRVTPSGTVFYIAGWKRWNIYYVVEGDVVKAVSLKHQLQR